MAAPDDCAEQQPQLTQQHGDEQTEGGLFDANRRRQRCDAQHDGGCAERPMVFAHTTKNRYGGNTERSGYIAQLCVPRDVPDIMGKNEMGGRDMYWRLMSTQGDDICFGGAKVATAP